MAELALVAGGADKKVSKKEAELVALRSYAVAHKESKAIERLLEALKPECRKILEKGERAFSLDDGTAVLMKLSAGGQRVFKSPLEMFKAGTLPIETLLSLCKFSASAIDEKEEALEITNIQVAALVESAESGGAKKLLCQYPKRP